MKIPVLDHGFVELVDTFGHDSTIVDCARVSYGKGTTKSSTNEALLRFLMRHQHTSPFEMVEILLAVKMPMFVARQWVRHRTANINEVSARYSEIEDELYIPGEDYLRPQGTHNKQMSDVATTLSNTKTKSIQKKIQKHNQQSTELYHKLLKDISRETARTVMPISTYTTMMWKIDAHNLMRFLKLRLGENAQPEIQAYAQAILEIFKQWLPVTAQAFQDYILDGAHLSKFALEGILAELSPDAKDRIIQAMPTKREQQEVKALLKYDVTS